MLEGGVFMLVGVIHLTMVNLEIVAIIMITLWCNISCIVEHSIPNLISIVSVLTI